MARRSTPQMPTSPLLTPAQKQEAERRLNQCISKLVQLDLLTVDGRRSPVILGLQASIDEALERAFGAGTSRFRRFKEAAYLEPLAVAVLSTSWSRARGGGGPAPGELHQLRKQIDERRARSIALLKAALDALEGEAGPSWLEERVSTTNHIHVSGDHSRVNLHSHDSSTNVVQHNSGDLGQLADQLHALRQALAPKATDAGHYAALGDVAKAEMAAKNGNSSEVHSALTALGAAGKWVLGTAREIGVNVAAEMITKSIGG